MTFTYLTLKIEHHKPIDQLADKAAQRVYNLDGVDNVEVVQFNGLKTQYPSQDVKE